MLEQVLDEVKNNHTLHAIAMGGAVYYLTGKPLYGSATAIGAKVYMDNYGHRLPFTNVGE